MKNYWVLYKTVGSSREIDSVVQVEECLPTELPQKLKEKVFPNRMGDPSDGLPSQSTKDCILLNWKELS